MNEGKGLHEGHRARITDKLLKSPDSMQEHELLEILLFQYIPRRNTNDIAHRLLRTFGCIKNVLNANEKLLMTVDGVGKKVAAGLVLTGKLLDSVHECKSHKFNEVISYETARQDFINYYRGLRIEKTVILLLDKRNAPLCQIEFEINSISKSFIDKTELASAIALNKPTFAIMAHNHPSGIAYPSQDDDTATLLVFELCGVLGVKLNDHIIVAGGTTYSYYHDGRLDELCAKRAPLN